MDVGGVDVLARKAERREHLEGEVVQLRVGEAEDVLAELFAQRELVEDELDVEGRRQRGVQRRDDLVGDALGLQRGGVDRRGLVEKILRFFTSFFSGPVTRADHN